MSLQYFQIQIFILGFHPHVLHISSLISALLLTKMLFSFLPKDLDCEFYATWKEVNIFFSATTQMRNPLVGVSVISDHQVFIVSGSQSGKLWLGGQFAPEASGPNAVSGWRQQLVEAPGATKGRQKGRGV